MRFENKQYVKSMNTIIEMLRLCPGDNMGQRYWLGSLLIRNYRFADALFFSQAWLLESQLKDGAPLERGGTIFRFPMPDLLTPDQEQRLSKWGSCSLLYTAALAAFKLSGNTPQACQYLRVASKSNPHVLVKILTRTPKPNQLNNKPRQKNGPEDAQDYLWLTQDLWMEPTVWSWANDNPDIKAALLRKCSRSECHEKEKRIKEFKHCGACQEAWYCGSSCQKEDWKKHKPECRAVKERNDYIRAMTNGKPPPVNLPAFTKDQHI